MHEVRREQQRAADGHRAAAEEPPREEIDEGQHQHTEERAGKAPAEWRHPEGGDEKEHNLLNQSKKRLLNDSLADLGILGQ